MTIILCLRNAFDFTLAVFSYAMLVGIVVGTYSSIFVAAGMIVEWWLRKPEKA